MTEAAGEEPKALQKSYSFDNVSFGQVDLHEVDMKYIGAIQKAMTALSAEMANDMATFTADDMAKTVKEAGPRSLTQSGCMDTLKKLLADAKTKQNAHTVIASLATTCTSTAEPLIVPLIPELLNDCAHKKAEIRTTAEGAIRDICENICPWACRTVLRMLYEGVKATKWQLKVAACKSVGSIAEKNPEAFARCLPEAMPVISEAMWDTKADVKNAAAECMQKCCASVSNRDIKPFVPALINAIQNPEEVS